ncbi:MAG: 5-keto-4-deoxyuronate isomerase, partial [Verrucomicrobia bacterium]|nr:5-keto-4-deoxyuronate isomerase [Verrucomicrobiota bacterium]
MTTHDQALSRLAGNFSPADLRREFLVAGLFKAGEITLHWWETDRAIMGGICPVTGDLPLRTPDAMRAGFFFERREAGLLNLGGPGRVRVDGTEYKLESLDTLYVGRGVRDVVFSSDDTAKPARFWLLSYPAHAAYPTRHISFQGVEGTRLGQRANANERTLYKLIHPGAFQTCQLVMGVT